jgi:signal transduction histidine kinase
MMDGENLNEDQKTNLNFITETVTRMSRMINNLLDAEAIEKGESKLLLENTELVTIIGSAIRNMQSLAIQKQINLTVKSKVTRAIVKADYVMLMEVLENLISNAIKFSHRQSTVEINCKIENSKAIICVKDAGVGMSAEDVEVVFKKYQKLSSKPTENEKSIGLGLSITKQYVEQMNGTIWCESEQGKGTSFYIMFPLLVV